LGKNRRSLVLRAFAAAVFSVGLASATTSSALAQSTDSVTAPASTASASAAADTDYLSAGSGAAECTKKTPARIGNWVCPDTTRTSATQAIQDAQKALGASAVPSPVVSAAAASSSWCDVQGCWDRIDSAHATFSGTGTYGYGGTTLGTMQLYFKVTAGGSAGKQIITYPMWMSVSRSSKNHILSVENLYISSAYPGGNSENPRHYAQKTYSSTLAGGVSRQWPSPGPSWTEGVAWVTVAAEGSWQDTSSAYPGTWYSWAKSLKLQKQASGAYYVYTPITRPSNYAGAGWRP
jgi:hypothetical protein